MYGAPARVNSTTRAGASGFGREMASIALCGSSET